VAAVAVAAAAQVVLVVVVVVVVVVVIQFFIYLCIELNSQWPIIGSYKYKILSAITQYIDKEKTKID
jgi:hypothetical protein